MFNNLYKYKFNMLIGNTVNCEPDWTWTSKVNNWSGYHLWYVLKGGATIKTKNVIHQVAPGDVYLFNMSTNHYCTHNPLDPLSVYTIYFTKNNPGCEDIPSQKISTKNSIFMKNLFEQAIYNFNRTTNEKNSFWLLSLLSFCYDNKLTTLDNQIESIINMINLHPFTHYSLDFLAKKSGYSKNQFIRLFKKQTSYTPSSYCIKIKIEKTKHFLLYTNYSIAKISDMAAFSDVSFFSKQFKQLTGLSPLSYRESHLPAKD